MKSGKARVRVEKVEDPNEADVEPPPTVSGLSHCLAMLAGEAAGLGMRRTVDALRRTLVICAEEAPRSRSPDIDFFDLEAPPPDAVRH